MTEPFIVALEKFQSRPRNPQLSLGDQTFAMQIAILAANKTDAWPPVEMKIPTPKQPYGEDALGLVRFPLLVAKWHKLPQTPATEQESLLEILASQDDHRYKPKLSLKIDAAWCEPTSPLQVMNAEIRETQKEASPQRSLLSPSSEEPLEKSIMKIEWQFEGLADFLPKLIFNGYDCPLCPGRGFRDAGEFHFHLIQSHELFKFKFAQTFETDRHRRSIINGLVKVDLADNYEAKAANSLDPREMVWQRPRNAFQLEAYLKGDESWVGKPVRKSHLNHDKLETSRSTSRDTSRPEIPVSAVRRPPSQVPDLVPPPRRKFRVPPAPNGIQFYRLTVKRPLVAGELVSESDDDIDEEWLLQKHADTIDSFTDTSREEKEFIQRYDRHMLKEDVSSDLHACEALIRFCRLNKSWLQRYDMKKEFHKKAAALKMQGCLDASTIWACTKIINEGANPAPPLTPTDEGAMDIDLPPGTVIAPTTPLSKPLPELPVSPPHEFGHLHGRCAVCSAGIYDMPSTIICTNPTCQRPDFHLSCVKLDSRPAKWLCEPCSLNPTAETGSSTPVHHSALPVRSLTGSPDAAGMGELRAVLGDGFADALDQAVRTRGDPRPGNGTIDAANGVQGAVTDGSAVSDDDDDEFEDMDEDEDEDDEDDEDEEEDDEGADVEMADDEEYEEEDEDEELE